MRERDIDALVASLLLQGDEVRLRRLAQGVAAIMNNEVPCPDCGHGGPHEDNGCQGEDLALSCVACGSCFQPPDYVEVA